MSHRKSVQCAGCPRLIAGGKTGYCCHCYPKFTNSAKIKFPWTPDWDSLLREAYARCTLGKTTVAIDKLQAVTGYPRSIVKLRAQRLGITRSTRKPWRKAEIEYLREHAGKLTAKQISRLLRRSHSSVTSQMELLKISRAVTRGYSVSQIAGILGVGEQQVRKFLQRGWLSMDSSHRILAGSVRHLLIEHMDYLDIRLMNQSWLKDELRAAFEMRAPTMRRAA